MRSVLLLIVVGCGGCGLSAEAKQEVRDQAAMSAADDRDCQAGRLTPAQKDISIHDSAKHWATFNLEVNGVPIPAEYATPSSATSPTTPGPTTPAGAPPK